MFTPPENKGDSVTDAIANLEKELEAARARADAVASKQADFIRRQFERVRGNLRPGQAGVVLPDDSNREREEIEREGALANAQVFRIERHLQKLRRLQ